MEGFFLSSQFERICSVTSVNLPLNRSAFDIMKMLIRDVSIALVIHQS